ncbi:Protein C34B4.3 [Aphelenchoides besseyi]|nr:Protein C34B4.3 [Aphelenchoides besseyi]
MQIPNLTRMRSEDWAQQPLSFDDLIAAGVLLSVGLVSIAFYSVVAYVMKKNDKDIVGFRFLFVRFGSFWTTRKRSVFTMFNSFEYHPTLYDPRAYLIGIRKETTNLASTRGPLENCTFKLFRIGFLDF